ncbi:type II secretion system minor pseudopilin GspK [Propionivibrio dicarboxylicus]|uniref:Type II secretion system protein K n=1 Tax=Propionivibrio dicarboxylicus TaxID=83767 RepID=A0A1G8ALU7_9RHOO|nr:type II secretion system minor pseudopilin GspK [Propionivibrio dicarboxylicus]SDH21877.1 general secretion pathway protein K [Propionivibrio dicarboxylicus]
MTRRHLPRKNEKGIALVTAILIVSFVASLAFALSARERLWLSQTQNRRHLATAQNVAWGAVDIARLSLRDDMRNTVVDHLMETWTLPVPSMSVEQGRVGGRVIEMQGRFNLMAVQSEGKINQSGVDALQRLLAANNLPSSWAERLSQALAAQVTSWQKAQKLNKTSAAMTRTMPVANLCELAVLAGIDPERLAILEPRVTILPEITAINVNFAAPEVLTAVVPGLSSVEAERLVSRRASRYFRSGQDFVNALPQKLQLQTPPSLFTVESQYFLVEVDAVFGKAQLRQFALLFRERNKMPEVVWWKRS